MERINLTQVKGGQGTSVTACAVAISAARRGRRVILDGDDRVALRAILGVGPDAAEVIPGLTLGDTSTDDIIDLVVYDGDGGGGTTLLVTRACYLALRRAVHHAPPANGVVLVEEPGRALTPGAIAAITGLPIVATISVNAATARAVDAGVLPMRLPASLAAAAAHILEYAAAAPGIQRRRCHKGNGEARVRRTDMRDQVEQLQADIEQGVAALVEGEDWQRWLQVAARFPRYSFRNTLLI